MPTSQISGNLELILAEGDGSTRQSLLSAAAQACAGEPGGRLADWIAYYADDGVAVLGLHYLCFAAR